MTYNCFTINKKGDDRVKKANDLVKFGNGKIKMFDKNEELQSVSDLAQVCAFAIFEDYQEICKDSSIEPKKRIDIGIKVTNALASVGMLIKEN